MADSEELRNLIDSAILGELDPLFEIKFTDSVFDHEEYYTSIPDVLNVKGFHVHHVPKQGVYLSKGQVNYHINFGVFDAVFINDMVEKALGSSHLTGFPVKFDYGKGHAGKLGNYSQVAAEHFRKLNVTPAQSDPSVVRLFKSDKVVRNENPETILIVPSKEVDDLALFQSIDDFGTLQISLPTEPGYWRVDIGQPTGSGNKPSTLQLWEKQLGKAKFSYKYIPTIGHLFFANTEGAKFGLPPTATHMRWPPLQLNDAVDPDPEPLAEPDEGWKLLVHAFRDEPCKLTFEKVLKDAVTRKAFRFYNRKGHIEVGSRDIGKKLRDKMTGYGRSVSFAEFAEFLESVSFPSGLEYYLCNLIKIGQVLSYDDKGKVYVH